MGATVDSPSPQSPPTKGGEEKRLRPSQSRIMRCRTGQTDGPSSHLASCASGAPTTSCRSHPAKEPGKRRFPSRQERGRKMVAAVPEWGYAASGRADRRTLQPLGLLRLRRSDNKLSEPPGDGAFLAHAASRKSSHDGIGATGQETGQPSIPLPLNPLPPGEGKKNDTAAFNHSPPILMNSCISRGQKIGRSGGPVICLVILIGKHGGWA